MKTNTATMCARTSRQRRIRRMARRGVKRGIRAADWLFELNLMHGESL